MSGIVVLVRLAAVFTSVAVAFASAPTVAADPPPPGPVPPVPTPPGPIPGLDLTTVLGQHAVPSAPGAGPGTPPNLSVFNNGYGIAQNIEPAAPGQGQQFGVAPGQENADASRREWLGRYIDMYRAGMLEGGLLGQVPQEQLGQPLPGTAPPPGTNIPPGLVQ